MTHRKLAPQDDNTARIADAQLGVVLVRKLVDAHEIIAENPARFSIAPPDALSIREHLLNMDTATLAAMARRVDVNPRSLSRDVLADRLVPHIEQGRLALNTQEAA